MLDSLFAADLCLLRERGEGGMEGLWSLWVRKSGWFSVSNRRILGASIVYSMQGLTVACYRKILAAGSPESQSVCVCVYVCVCVWERERERERESKVMRMEREGVQMLEFNGQNSCDHFEPVLHPATKPLPSPPPRRSRPRCTPAHNMAASVRFRVPSRDTALLNIDQKRMKRIPANQGVTDCLPKLFEQPIVAVAVNEKIFFLQFFKKSRKSFLKKPKAKKKKKQNSAEKQKFDIPEKQIDKWLVVTRW